MKKILLYFALKYNGDFTKMYQAIKGKEEVDKNKIVNIEKQIKSKYITILDDKYPVSLKNIPNPPFVLFYYGNIDLLSKINIVGIIGTRKNSEYGKQMAIKITTGLKKYDSVVISGMANGIDGIAQECAIDNEISTIGVLGSGIDYCYPPNNIKLYENIKNKGLLISEYPNSLPPVAVNFLIRNRIIAALSNYIVVIEAKKKSGTMNTVAYGLEYGKDICCVPYLATINSGCNELIKECARLIECAKDIFE